MGVFLRQSIALFFVTFVTVVLVACGDSTTKEITQIVQEDTEVVASAKDLPKCTSENEGAQVWVKKDGVAKFCVDGNWISVPGAVDDDYECSTRELSDGSGYKIVCNGDSIAVVLNGAKGEDGKNGQDGQDGVDGQDGLNGKDGLDGSSVEISDCGVIGIQDSLVTVKCGEQVLTVRLGNEENPTEDADSVVYAPCVEDADEDSDCSLEDLSISGRSEKGPFLRGATVTAYELRNGRTLRQTGKSFNGEIDADDGLFNIKSVKLASQYVIIRVNGVYRNEVTGQNSDNSIELRALTNLKGRTTANVNLLTHLEYNRVSYLVTKKGMSVAAAKSLAEREILAAFNIDTTGILLNGKSENASIFGTSDENAALLAISIMLQGDRAAADLKALLSAVSYDMEDDGTWDDSTTRAEVAQWAMEASLGFGNRDSAFRRKIMDWHISTQVPDFEKFLRTFWTKEYGIGECGKDARVDSVAFSVNENIEKYALKKYEDAGMVKNGENWSHFICKDSAGIKFWRHATDIELDTVGFGFGNASKYREGDVRNGRVNSSFVYVYNGTSWRRGTELDRLMKAAGGVACATSSTDETMMARLGDTSKVKVDGVYYVCGKGEALLGDTASRWQQAPDWYSDTYEARSRCTSETDGDTLMGLVKKTNVYVCDYENADGDVYKNWEPASDIEKILGGCRESVNEKIGYDSLGFANGRYYVCQQNAWKEANEIQYNTYRVKCSENGELVVGVVDYTKVYTCDNGSFRISDDVYERFLGKGCVSYLEGSETIAPNKTHWNCNSGKWTWDGKAVAGSITDSRDGKIYTTTAIDTMTWLAENLNFEYNVGTAKSVCPKGDADSCAVYGRLYTWSAAMDSAALFSESGKDCGSRNMCLISQPARGVCPEGWHIPTIENWNELLLLAGGALESGVKLRAGSLWKISGGDGMPYGEVGTNDYGFSALPANATCDGRNAYFWSSSMSKGNYVFDVHVFYVGGVDTSYYTEMSNTISVRCLKD